MARIKHPAKQHDGRTITIRALPGTISKRSTVTGIYEHLPRKPGFFFRYRENSEEKIGLLMRDEWEVIAVRK